MGTKQNHFTGKRSAGFLRGNEYFARLLMNILHFNRLHKIYSGIAGKEGIEFIDELIKILDCNIDFDENELKRIPASGPLIVVANHPLSGFDSLILIKYLSLIRTDIMIWGNSELKNIQPVSNYFSIENLKDLNKIDAGGFEIFKHATAHLNQNGVVCFFPAGDEYTQPFFENFTEKVWKFPIINFIKNSQVPVLPFYFQDKSSRFLNFLIRINPTHQIGRIPSELLSKKHKSIKIRIGNPVSVEQQNKFEDVFRFGRFLRAKTFGLQSNIEIKPFFNYSLKAKSNPEPVIEPVPLEKLLFEVQKIREDYTLFKLKNYTVFCAPSIKIPNILNEIGRLREITFREVGEGTNHNIDVDEFDLYYNQLFIWDKSENKLVGAYRIGMGKDILVQYGKRGFYLQTLFRISKKFKAILNESLELGRSFVVPEYQRKPLPLFLLWKGILYFLLKNPEYRYLIGPVSISNNYSEISKELIIKFIMSNHLNWKMAGLIKPRKSYKFKSANDDINVLMENMEHDINMLDKTIADLDELNSGLPVLLKKYIKLNAKIIGFNVDPKFNNSLDGFIILDVFDVPEHTIESLSKDVNDGSILKRFYSSRE